MQNFYQIFWFSCFGIIFTPKLSNEKWCKNVKTHVVCNGPKSLYMKSHLISCLLFCPDFRQHLKSVPCDTKTVLDCSKTRPVLILDPHCQVIFHFVKVLSQANKKTFWMTPLNKFLTVYFLIISLAYQHCLLKAWNVVWVHFFLSKLFARWLVFIASLLGSKSLDGFFLANNRC